MNKIRVIDLLNKIANGEEVPEKIKFGDDIYYRKTDANEGYVIDYLDNRDNSLFNFITDYKFCFIKSCLEWEIKDLEEEKKIPEKLDVISWDKCIHGVTHKEKELAIEINKTQELLNQVLDYLKSKGE